MVLWCTTRTITVTKGGEKEMMYEKPELLVPKDARPKARRGNVVCLNCAGQAN